MYLSSEFNLDSGRHNQFNLNTPDKNKLKKNQLKIIDNCVFDQTSNNVALSKNAFADYIFQAKAGFHNFDFGAFEEVFMIIENILKHHAETIK